MKNNDAMLDLNRRDFLKGGSFATVMSLLGGIELKAQEAGAESEKKKAEFKMKCAVIGMGRWGRELVATLSTRPEAEIAAVCDTYPAYLRRGMRAAPGAEGLQDYRKILANKDIQAVFVATPTYQHRDITLEALQAGKHVYCEAPLAHTVEDARAIAAAARAAFRSNFQPGLQMRSDPERQFLLPFIRSGAMGNQVKVRSQWNKKDSWRQASPNPEREKELNWRLRQETSPGLIGEVGIHQVDAMAWFLNKRPQAVTGFGSITQWKDDGRDVDDTVQAVFEYEGELYGTFDGTLASSFDSDYEIYYGSMGTVMVRGSKAWMFKEADSPMLGWEVYALKETFYKETGIALVANATKLTTVTKKTSAGENYEDTPLVRALEAFLYNSHLIGNGVTDFVSTFGNDDAALKDYLADLGKNKLPAATGLEGFEATVMALKANEAIRNRQRLIYQDEWFQV
jgi:predicted dehydrogenase